MVVDHEVHQVHHIRNADALVSVDVIEEGIRTFWKAGNDDADKHHDIADGYLIVAVQVTFLYRLCVDSEGEGHQ